MEMPSLVVSLNIPPPIDIVVDEISVRQREIAQSILNPYSTVQIVIISVMAETT